MTPPQSPLRRRTRGRPLTARCDACGELQETCATGGTCQLATRSYEICMVFGTLPTRRDLLGAADVTDSQFLRRGPRAPIPSYPTGPGA